MSQITEKKEHFTKFQRKILGVYWYKNNQDTSDINPKLKAMYHCLNNKKNDEQVILRKNRFDYLYGIANLNEIELMIKKDNNIFEVIPENGKRKIYFDIDCNIQSAKGNFQEHLTKCKEIISSFFLGAEFHISGIESENKFSYHIILSNYYALKHADMYKIRNFCEFYIDYGFDPAVYKKNNLFKCINQSKGYKKITDTNTKKQITFIDKRIQKYISGSTDLKKHLVMWNFDKHSININIMKFDNYITIGKNVNLTAKEKRDKLNYKNQGVDISKLQISRNNLPFEFDYNNTDPLEKLNVLPNYPRGSGKELHHNLQMNVMWWCKNRHLLFDDFWKWCSKKDSSIDRKRRYYDAWGISNYIVDAKLVDILLEQFYPKLKENYNFHRYEILCDTSEYTTKMLKESEYLSVDDISEKKIQVFAVGCGKNKTGTAIDYIKKNINKKVVIIVPRISLAYDFQGRLEEEGIEIENYKTLRGIDEIAHQEKIIISAESLYKLQIHKYDIVILDEFETLINSFFSTNTHKEHLPDNWRAMIKMIKESQKTFIMDAITTLKTINFIKYLGYENDFSLINNVRVKEREIQIMEKPKSVVVDGEKQSLFEIDHERMFFSLIIESLNKGEKCFVFMPYKEGRKEKSRDSQICIRGVLPLMNYICKKLGFEKGKDIEGYYSEAFEEKKDLKDVNEVWKYKKCIITNTCSSVGINYNLNDFDKVFIYHAGWVNPRDIIQATKRPRKIKDIKMIMYEEKGYDSLLKENTLPTTFRCDIYEKMKKMILIEINCFCKEALYYLCKHNGIEILRNKIKVDYEISQELIKFDKNDNFCITYNSIADLDFPAINYLQELNEFGEITLYQKYQIEKYYFKLENDYNTPKEEDLHFMWLYRDYIDKFNILLKDEYHSINSLLWYHKTPLFKECRKFLDIEKFDFREDGYIPNNFELKQFSMIEDFVYKNIEKNMGQSTYMKVINSFFGEGTLTYVYDSGNIVRKKNQQGKNYNELRTKFEFSTALSFYKAHNRKFNKRMNVYSKYSIKEDLECFIE